MADATDSPHPSPAPHPPARAFGRTFWMLNSIEMFERLAYFGIRSVVPIYIMQATEPGGLHLTAVDKGVVYMWWAIVQSWLPMFTGGIADRYGYKRVLAGAITANAIGYVMMAYLHGYYGFFAGILVLATGTAFFKPALQGSLAQSLTKKNASMGWGVFYWVVNVGAVMAPVFATIILGKPHSAQGWENLFLASAIYTAMNLLLLLTFKDVPSGADKSLSVVKVFWVTVENIWPYWFRGGRYVWERGVPGLVLFAGGLLVLILKPFESGLMIALYGGIPFAVGLWLLTWLRGGQFTWQLRLPAFILIMSCFWMMMYQLWDLHPNFIEDWIDSSMVAAHVPTDSWREYGDRGLVRVPQQILLNLNAFLIVLLVVPISYLVRKMRTLAAMLIGMTVATTGILVAGLTGNGWVLLLGVLFFSLGEMLTGPKKNQYLGLIAPPGKKGLYLGYVNIPIGIGVGFGSLLAGFVYDQYGEKATLALKHLGANTQLVARAARSSDWSDSLHLIPKLVDIDRSEAFSRACQEMTLDSETGAGTLLRAFQFDQGQIENLCLQYLALEARSPEEVAAGLAKALEKAEDDPGAKALAEKLSTGKASPDTIGIARFVHLLPKALGRKRVEVFDIVRENMNRDASKEDYKQDSAIVDALWSRFREDAPTLNNLALEFLAQNTSLVADAAGGVTFKDPVEEMEKRIGIGRTKSFTALCAAMGASDAAIDEALSSFGPTGDMPDLRAYGYIIERPHHRFIAIARKDWSTDLVFLRELIRTDPQALGVVRKEIDKVDLIDAAITRLKSLFGLTEEAGEVTDEGIDYKKLAGKQDLIHKALDAKDWSRSHKEAAELLALNPFEAKAVVAAEVNLAAQSVTKLLWNEYKPQYFVWLPFATIGILAAIALAIFGHKAKKWSDMNA